jgi:hypothetical protein
VPQRKVESATLQAFRDWLLGAAAEYRQPASAEPSL